MSDGAVLGLVAFTLAIVLAGVWRLVAVLDSADLALRRLVAGVWSARRAVAAAGELAAAVERDAARGQAELERLQAVKRPRPEREADGGAGPVSLPFRPGPARR
ncbi:MAG TPA: hypothetical protein VFS16_07515 [Acidimicrobiia bacterium]|nr:hypothetical protein [Acidimicrobiia bacterium]